MTSDLGPHFATLCPPSTQLVHVRRVSLSCNNESKALGRSVLFYLL